MIALFFVLGGKKYDFSYILADVTEASGIYV